MYPQNQRPNFEYSLSPQDAYYRRERYNNVQDTAARGVALFGSVLTTLLGARFAFALLDANQANGIVSFVNDFTDPFVAPFKGMLVYDHASVGAISFQGYTLLAIIGYGLLTAGVARLATVARY